MPPTVWGGLHEGRGSDRRQGCREVGVGTGHVKRPMRPLSVMCHPDTDGYGSGEGGVATFDGTRCSAVADVSPVTPMATDS